MCCRMYCYRIWTLLIILMLILIISNNFVVLKSHGIWFELNISWISGNRTTGSGSGGDNRTAAAWIGWWRWCGWHVKRIGRGQHVQINTEYPHVRFRFRFCVCVVLLLKFDKIFLKNPERFIFSTKYWFYIKPEQNCSRPWRTGRSKGQLISKCHFGVSNYPRKRTWKLKFLP